MREKREGGWGDYWEQLCFPDFCLFERRSYERVYVRALAHKRVRISVTMSVRLCACVFVLAYVSLSLSVSVSVSVCVDVYVFVSACMCARRWGCLGGFKTKTSFSRGDSSVQSVFVHIYKSIRVCITRPIYTQAVGRRVSVNRCIVYTRRDKGPDRGLHLARTPLQALRARPGRFCSLPKGSQGRCL